MTNYNYNGLNAHDIASKVIAKEEAYENADYSTMPFEDKCHYALANTPIIHISVAPNRSGRRELLEGLLPELLRRAANDDAFALYVLGSINSDLSAPSTDNERRFLERSMNVGHVPAALSLLDRFYYGKKRSESEAKHILAWLAEHVTEDSPAAYRHSYYTLIEDQERAMEISLQFAMAGDYSSVIYLANRTHDAAEKALWERVQFLVCKHFYDKGAKHLGNTIARKLLSGRGCEQDVEQAHHILECAGAND